MLKDFKDALTGFRKKFKRKIYKKTNSLLLIKRLNED